MAKGDIREIHLVTATGGVINRVKVDDFQHPYYENRLEKARAEAANKRDRWLAAEPTRFMSGIRLVEVIQ